MNAQQLLERIHAAGGTLTLKGDRIVVEVPEDATPLLDELRAVRDEAYRLLHEAEAIPELPSGVRLVEWRPKPTPVMITYWAVVTDLQAFIRSTLRQLDHALAWEAGDEKHRWLAGNWSVREHIDRLEQCGVIVKVESKPCTSG
jgi:hypothetical protein